MNSCRQELWLPDLDKNRFKGTDLIKSALKDNDDATIAKLRSFGKIL